MAAHPPFFANGQVMMIDPTTVDSDEAGRIGLLFPAKVEALGILIKANGQNTPISVKKNGNRAKFAWTLVAGRHRLAACLNDGLEVAAIEVLGGAEALRAIQASENMDRRELAPLERAMFVHAVAEAAKARVLALHDGKSQIEFARDKLAEKRQNHWKDKMSSQSRRDEMRDADVAAANAEYALKEVYGWLPETAEACGLGQKDVQRSLRIYHCVVGPNRDLIDGFKDHPVAQVASELLTIASIKDPGLRRTVIETLIGGPSELDYVLRMHGLKAPDAKPDAYTKFSSQILGGWGRLGTAEKRRFIPEFAASVPVGMRQALRDELDRLDSGK